MPVAYNSKRLIPAPFIAISKEVNTQDDGKPIGQTYTIVVRGKMVAWMGSPNSSETFWDQPDYPPSETLTSDQWLGSILRKQEAINELFSTDGHVFEIDPIDGSTPMKCNPKIKRIEFPEGHWAETADYVITMETNCIVGLKDFCINSKISKATEEWNIEPLDEAKHTFRLTHSVTATGQRVFEPDGSITQESWLNAKDYVLNMIGLGIKPERMSAPGVLDATNLAAYNYLRAQHANELGGFFGVTETWLCYDPQGEAPAIDDCTVTTRVSQEGRSSVSVEGNITGLQVSNNTTYAVTSSRYTNASSKWATVMASLLTRAQTVSGVTLNPTVLNTQVGANEVNGTISYHHEYDDRPTATVPGAKWEKISVVDRNPADVFARIPVLGRALGPILQAIQTITEFRRNVTIEVQMPCKTMVFTPTKPSTAALVLGYTPIGIGSSVFIEQDDENWLDYDGRYSRNTTFCCNRGKAL